MIPDECDYPCTGNINEICGSSWRLSVYGPNQIIDLSTLKTTTPTTPLKTTLTTTTSSVTTIVIKSGAVVDGISIENGIDVNLFGFFSACENCGKEQITLDEDENIQSMTYGRSSHITYRYLICNLSFQTNKRVFGPFASRSNRCSGPIYSVDIPSEMMLVDFFNQDLKTKLNWAETGNMETFFDGFTSEYKTSITTTTSILPGTFGCHYNENDYGAIFDTGNPYIGNAR